FNAVLDESAEWTDRFGIDTEVEQPTLLGASTEAEQLAAYQRQWLGDAPTAKQLLAGISSAGWLTRFLDAQSGEGGDLSISTQFVLNRKMNMPNLGAATFASFAPLPAGGGNYAQANVFPGIPKFTTGGGGGKAGSFVNQAFGLTGTSTASPRPKGQYVLDTWADA